MVLVASGSGRLTARQYEAGRVILSRGTKRETKIEMPCFINLGVTKKAERSRIGKGKGVTDHWVFVVCPGDILYSLTATSGREESIMLDDWSGALKKCGLKIPFATKVLRSAKV